MSTPTTARGAVLRRAGTLLAAAALVAAPAAAVLSPSAAMAASTDPTLVGAHYLQQQLAAGGHHFSVTAMGVIYPDHGVTADAVLALAAAGTAQDEAALATAWLADDVVGYLGYGEADEVGAGSAAKLLNVALAQGEDPTSFGGYDLLTTLQGLEQPSGRFSDKTKYPDYSDPTKLADYSNTFGQSFALIGLDRAGEPVSDAARQYLLTQQCPGGGFQLYMSDAGCTSDDSADPDATAMAVQALIAVGGSASAAGEGLDYLESRQDASGGVGGGGPQSGANANSTGLAGQAFLAGGRTSQARAAVTFLTGLQYGCDFPVALRGGIAYDAAAFAATKAAGAAAAPVDQDRRSTSQALLALAGTPLASVTADGADAVAPALTCTTPTSTPTTTGGATSTPTTSASTTPRPSTSTSSATATASGGGTATGSDDTAATTGSAAGGSGSTGAGGSLARTGSDLVLPVGLGLVLVVVGGVVIAATRRQGAHR
ncbi:MAG TPA: prenyltransferase/squalene oxidase repeat-containing protein [Ornithinibacter sp.]|nr:prenyltransferase/squalene oxidase repeat-containing protein [Ornithinibacter sp.]